MRDLLEYIHDNFDMDLEERIDLILKFLHDNPDADALSFNDIAYAFSGSEEQELRMVCDRIMDYSFCKVNHAGNEDDIEDPRDLATTYVVQYLPNKLEELGLIPRVEFLWN